MCSILRWTTVTGATCGIFLSSAAGFSLSNSLSPSSSKSFGAWRTPTSRGIVHRDVKPENVLLHGGKKRWRAKVSDFGLAKNFEQAGLSGMTKTNAYGGTYKYMPREQLTDLKYVRPCQRCLECGGDVLRDADGVAPAREERWTGSDRRDPE